MDRRVSPGSTTHSSRPWSCSGSAAVSNCPASPRAAIRRRDRRAGFASRPPPSPGRQPLWMCEETCRSPSLTARLPLKVGRALRRPLPSHPPSIPSRKGPGISLRRCLCALRHRHGLTPPHTHSASFLTRPLGDVGRAMGTIQGAWAQAALPAPPTRRQRPVNSCS